MHTPEQSPEQSAEEIQQSGALPIYEFAPDEVVQPPELPAVQEPAVSAATDGNVSQPVEMPSEEAIRQGLIYPPPPSFYQNVRRQEPEQMPASMPPTPEMRPVMPPPFPLSPPPPARKKSRAWIWIVVAILLVAFIASCGLCSWAFSGILTDTYRGIANAQKAADNYYAAVKAQNYTSAYSYLALSPSGSAGALSDQQFAQQARQLDDQHGAVTTYSVGTPSPANDSSAGSMDLTRMVVTVNVERNKQSYQTYLTLQNINGQWKIVDFSRI